ncbi:hypothetical protein AB0L63_19865 [Nocardia sp. NPDC051990]|uniref:hypothetical protein n=1 Tax=Nocardia sp. NPDC051990 TaxID=3155285 RepID=UPI00341BD5AB
MLTDDAISIGDGGAFLRTLNKYWRRTLAAPIISDRRASAWIRRNGLRGYVIRTPAIC